jgi:acyl-CoA thioester hydrolase
MGGFRFYHPLEVRYSDVDAQRHVNNACYFTYMEEARAKYFEQLGLWDGKDFDAVGVILLETSCTFRKPIFYGQSIRVGVRTCRIGRKSLEVETSIEDAVSEEELAAGRSILVSFAYQENRSIPVPDLWRETVDAFEGLS